MGIRTRVETLSLVRVAEKIQRANSLNSPRSQWIYYIIGLTVSDACMTYFALLLAHEFRFDVFNSFFELSAVDPFADYPLLIYSTPLLWLFMDR